MFILIAATAVAAFEKAVCEKAKLLGSYALHDVSEKDDCGIMEIMAS